MNRDSTTLNSYFLRKNKFNHLCHHINAIFSHHNKPATHQLNLRLIRPQSYNWQKVTFLFFLNNLDIKDKILKQGTIISIKSWFRFHCIKCSAIRDHGFCMSPSHRVLSLRLPFDRSSLIGNSVKLLLLISSQYESKCIPIKKSELT